MNGRRVVITGIGTINGLGNTLKDSEQRLRGNESSIREVSRFDTTGMIGSVAAEVSVAKQYGLQNGLPYDECARYAIAAAEDAIALSGQTLDDLVGRGAGLALGLCCGGVSLSEEVKAHSFHSGNPAVAKSPLYEQTDTVAQQLGLTGPVLTFNTACSASGSAIGFASEWIAKGYTDVMLAGGAEVLMRWVMNGFSQLRALNPEPCSPFGDGLGLSLGEGSTIFVLESLEAAKNRDAVIYGEMIGYGLTNDAYHPTAPLPEGRGIRDAILMALRDGRTDAAAIDYFNAHGTGTKLNDQAELIGIRDAIGEERFPLLPISSSKGHVGHMLGAAASTEFAFSLLALNNGYMPGTANTRELRDGCDQAKVLIDPMSIQRGGTFLSCNAAMGGHNSILLGRSWTSEDTDRVDTGQMATNKRIYIIGIGMVDPLGAECGAPISRLGREVEEAGRSTFNLRKYNASLHERGVNRIVQLSLGATDLAIRDANWRQREDQKEQAIGMVFGTSFGEAEAVLELQRAMNTDAKGGSTSINFPKGALNSAAGIVSKILGLTDFSSSISTGGNDGLYALAFAFEAINGTKGVDRCLAAASEELSEWMDTALGSRTDQQPDLRSEGACTIAIEAANENSQPPSGAYAEIAGLGFSFAKASESSSETVQRAVRQCLERSSVSPEDVDAVLVSFTEQAGWEAVYGLFPDQPIIAPHANIGHTLSAQSLQHVAYAADLLSIQRDTCAAEEQAGIQLPHALKRIVVVGSSLNGGAGAVLLAAVDQNLD